MILFGYTHKSSFRQQRVEAWALGLFHPGGLVFQLVCHVHRYWASSSKPTVRPKMESCFQDGACSVCFLLHSPLLMLLTHSMSIIHRDILHPDSLTSNLGEQHQPLSYKVHNTLWNKGSTKQNYQGNYNNGKYSFPPIPFTQNRAKVQKGRLSSDITFT